MQIKDCAVTVCVFIRTPLILSLLLTYSFSSGCFIRMVKLICMTNVHNFHFYLEKKPVPPLLPPPSPSLPPLFHPPTHSQFFFVSFNFLFLAFANNILLLEMLSAVV